MESSTTPFVRRWLFIALAAAALVTLVALPWAGFRKVEVENAKTHDLTIVLAAMNATSSSVASAVAGPVRSFELSRREADYERVEDALYWIDEAVLLLEESLPAAERIGLETEVEAYLDSTNEFLVQLGRREDAFRNGADADKLPNAGAYFVTRTNHLKDQEYLGAMVVELAGELDESRTDAMNTAQVLLYVALGVAITSLAMIGVLEMRRARGQMAATETRLAAAERAAEQRADMVNLASHELRNPLAVMSLAAQMLQSTAATSGDPLLEQVAADAYAASRRSEALVAELLDLSRLDANRLKLAIQPVPLAGVLDEAVSLTAHHLGERPVRLTGVERAMVLADPGRLAIILRNLVDNAFKYSPPGSEVAVVATPSPGVLELQVRDRGPGIPATERERVFERFERLHSTGHIGGIGIGLHLSRELARKMGGELSVIESGEGACLRLVLPTPETRAEAA